MGRGRDPRRREIERETGSSPASVAGPAGPEVTMGVLAGRPPPNLMWGGTAFYGDLSASRGEVYHMLGSMQY